MGELKLPNSVSLEFVEALYADFLRDPESVPPDWRSYFQSLSDGNSASSFKPSFKPSGNGAVTEETATALLQERVDQLIRNYRVRGHMGAQIDPLGISRATPPELDLSFYDLTEADMRRRIA